MNRSEEADVAGVIRTRSQNSKNHMRNEGNYLIGLKSCNRTGGVIRPWWEQEWLRRGRITPTVAVVNGAQELVFIQQICIFLSVLNGVLRTGDIRTRSYN